MFNLVLIDFKKMSYVYHKKKSVVRQYSGGERPSQQDTDWSLLYRPDRHAKMIDNHLAQPPLTSLH